MVIDWQRLLGNLMETATIGQIGAAADIPPPYLSDLLYGLVADPDIMGGARLLNLHLDTCGIEEHKKLVVAL
jgi:hypothetical protein